MSTVDRVVSCATSPMLADAMKTAEEVLGSLRQLSDHPGSANAAMISKLNYHVHQANDACVEALITRRS